MIDNPDDKFFFGTPTEDLIVVDAYTVDSTATVNKLPDINDKLETAKLNWMKESHDISEAMAVAEANNADLAKFAQAKALALSVDSASLEKGIISSDNKLLSAFKSLSKEIQAKLTVVKGVTKVVSDINGVRSVIKGTNLSTLNGVSTVINQLTNLKLPIKFEDKSGLINLATNTIKTANRIGIPNSFSAFSKSLTDVKVLSNIVKELTPEVTETSSTALMKDIANSQVKEDVLKYQPDFINEFSRKYTKPEFASVTAISNEFVDINSSFTKLDPNWGTCKRADYTTVYDASTLTGMSKDLKEIYTTGTDMLAPVIDRSKLNVLNTAANTAKEKYLLVANMFDNVKTITSLKKDFPLTKISV